MSLATGERISRRQYTLPITQRIIERVEGLASAQGQPLLPGAGAILAWNRNGDQIVDNDEDAHVRQCTDVLMIRRSFSSLEPIVPEERTKMSRLLHVASSCKFLPFRFLSVIGRAGQARHPQRLTRTVLDLSHPARHIIRLPVAGCTCCNHVFDSSVSIL
jgi:hypothetical protein